jgi:hypothetical protein
MAALPKSPAGHRRTSSGGGLRPVVPFGLDSGVVETEDDDDEIEMGPAPRENSEPFAEGAGVDEVEYAYGYVPFWHPGSLKPLKFNLVSKLISTRTFLLVLSHRVLCS